MTTTARRTAPAQVGDLLLTRLLPPAKSPPSPGAVRRQLDGLLPHPLSADGWDGLVSELRADGLLAARGLRLTDAGRARALAALGVRELPARVTWPTIVSRYLAPRGLGFDPGSKIGPDALAARLLAKELDLPVGSKPTLTGVLVAAAAKELGFAGETDWNRLRRRVLSRLAGSDEVLTSKELPKAVLAAVLDIQGGADALRRRAVRDWLAADEPARPPAPGPDEPFDLPAFAATVRAVARACPTGRFGGNKVFIGHLWRHLRDEPSFPPLDLPGFKRRLVEASVARLLDLERADQVQAMDPADVRESATEHLSATFHFVLTDGGTAP
jgi:hypothetical protein